MGSDATKSSLLKPGYKLLIVEDEPMLLEFLGEDFAELGVTVELASDGQHALEKLRNSPEAFQAVVSDLRMPRLGGMALLQKAKSELPSDRQPKAWIALTAYDDQAEGFDEVFLKPCSPTLLANALSTLLIRAE